MLSEIGLVGAISITVVLALSIGVVSVLHKSQLETPHTRFDEIPGKTNFAEDVSEGAAAREEKEYPLDPEEFD